MKKVGLVLEGGGLRGAYTAGILLWLLDQGLSFDYGAAISISSLYLFAFMSGNKELIKDACINVAGSPSVGPASVLREGNFVGYEKMFSQVVNHKSKMDIEKLHSSKMLGESGIFDINEDKAIWFNHMDVDAGLLNVKAACTLPFFGKPVKMNGHRYYDGGVFSMIPVERAREQGCEKILVITTKPADYVRKPFSPIVDFYLKTRFGKDSLLYNDLHHRVDIYKHEHQVVKELGEQGICFHMFPSKSSKVTRFGGTPEQLTELCDLGYSDAEANREQILALFKEN